MGPPAIGGGRAHYYAARGSVALGSATVFGLVGNAIAGHDVIHAGPLVEAGVALVAASAFVISLRCLVGFWSVPARERSQESSLPNSSRDRSALMAGWALTTIGSVALAASLLLHHWPDAYGRWCWRISGCPRIRSRSTWTRPGAGAQRAATVDAALAANG